MDAKALSSQGAKGKEVVLPSGEIAAMIPEAPWDTIMLLVIIGVCFWLAKEPKR